MVRVPVRFLLPFAAGLVVILACPTAQAAPAPEPSPAAGVAPAPQGSFLFMPRGNRWLAATLSMGVNGLGQLYNGENEEGLLMMSMWLTYPAAFGVDFLTSGTMARTFSWFLNAGIKTWSVWDAFQGPLPPKGALVPWPGVAETSPIQLQP